jgi:CheY-like chemotaxis protein
MDSEIGLRSEPGHGSLFWFEIDLPVLDDTPALPVEWRTVVGYEGPIRRVLVVDDVPANRALLRDMLTPLGFECCEAGDGQQALERMRDSRPDLVLMDVVMPGMDGLEVTRHMRQMPGGQDLPIIAITADASALHREQCMAAGVNAFLTKPIEWDRLLEVIGKESVLQWRTAAAQS